MENNETHQCPVCTSQNTSFFAKGENRLYIRCAVCDLVFVPERFFVSAKEEKAKYDHHQNSIENRGYVDFLNRLLLPLQMRLKPNAKGLDFGSGPGPTLHLLMRQAGYEMDIYDIFYHHDPTVFHKTYDFITMTEVIEHLHHPMRELERLWKMLQPDGYLGIMTAFRPEIFEGWYYKRDKTHIRFFTEKTFTYIAQTLDAKLDIVDKGVILLQKSV